MNVGLGAADGHRYGSIPPERYRDQAPQGELLPDLCLCGWQLTSASVDFNGAESPTKTNGEAKESRLPPSTSPMAFTMIVHGAGGASSS